MKSKERRKDCSWGRNGAKCVGARTPSSAFSLSKLARGEHADASSACSPLASLDKENADEGVRAPTHFAPFRPQLQSFLLSLLFISTSVRNLMGAYFRWLVAQKQQWHHQLD